MAQEGIKKGFFFYFGLFVLFLIAVFLIICVIMIFNPGTNILWMQYFTSTNPQNITETTDTGEAINFDNITRIEVDCSYADVQVKVDGDIGESCVRIENNSKGFATAEQARPFSYSVIIENGTLKIAVTEPVGFIYFSNDVSITINIDSGYYNGDFFPDSSFDGTAFNIETTDGNITFGSIGFESQPFAPASITAKTTGGSIYLSENLELDQLTQISLETGSGDIRAQGNNLSADGDENTGIDVTNADVNLTTNTGNIDLDVVRIGTSGTLRIANENGNVTISKLDVPNKNITSSNQGDKESYGIQMDSYEGNYYIDTIIGDLSFSPSEDNLGSPNIRIGTITGDMLVSSSLDANPDVTIETMNGNIYSFGTNGNYIINNMKGNAVIDIESGSVDIKFVEQTNNGTDIITSTNGAITIGFKGAINHDMTITSDSANINFNFLNNVNFVANAYVNDGTNNQQNEVVDDDRITINIGNYHGDKNPVSVNNSGVSQIADLIIYTNANITYTLVDSL